MLTPSFVNSIEPPITTQKVFTPNYLAKQIQDCGKEQFTGRLDLNFKNPQGQQWCLFFRRGDLIWCASEVHPIRRWCRQLSLHCPQLTIDSEGRAPDAFKDAEASTSFSGTASLPLTQTDYSGAKASPQASAVGQGSLLLPCWDYDSLIELIRQGKVQQGQMAAVITGNITEILFDIHQQWERVGYNCELQLTYRSIPKHTLDLIDPRLLPIRTDLVWQQAIQAWKAWQQAALTDYCPNWAPTIWQPKKLRQQTSPTVYRNLTDLINGNQTLRDLAVKLKQNLLPLTQSIVPYIREGLIGLIEVEDFSYSIKPTTATKPATATNPLGSPVAPPVSSVQPQPTASLVVCIDDSRIDSLAMNHILTQAGYRCINVQDPVQALPILLENKPDLIFLDLVMPVANGYEICAQIRRISVFKDTPVIILTSNDGIVDRVRAKMVGSSGFLAKPIDQEKVLKTLQRYLGTSTLIPSQKLQTVQD